MDKFSLPLILFSCYRLLILDVSPPLLTVSPFRSYYYPLVTHPLPLMDSLCIHSCFVLHFPFLVGEVDDSIKRFDLLGGKPKKILIRAQHWCWSFFGHGV